MALPALPLLSYSKLGEISQYPQTNASTSPRKVYGVLLHRDGTEGIISSETTVFCFKHTVLKTIQSKITGIFADRPTYTKPLPWVKRQNRHCLPVRRTRQATRSRGSNREPTAALPLAGRGPLQLRIWDGHYFWRHLQILI